MTGGYYSRIIDSVLERKLKTFGAIHIVGPKWCGKTTSAKQAAKSSLMLQKYPDKESLIKTAEINPAALLSGEKPRLIDEWQDAPQIWDAVRFYCDENPGTGHFILTGSTSKKVSTSHTGTGRISKLKMYPMSLFESKESNGTVSLKKLFDGTEDLKDGCKSDLTIPALIFAACRGGWPASVCMDNPESQLLIPKDYCEQIVSEDMFKVDGRKRNPATMRALLQSYARNISTLAKSTNILTDVSATNKITENTLDDYISVLESLFIVEDLRGWSPAIRSASAMRSGRKREFVPSRHGSSRKVKELEWLAESAARDGHYVEAYFWALKAHYNGSRTMTRTLAKYCSEWVRHGKPDEKDNVRDEFSAHSGSFARCVLRIQCGIHPHKSLARIHELAHIGHKESLQYLHRHEKKQ